MSSLELADSASIPHRFYAFGRGVFSSFRGSEEFEARATQHMSASIDAANSRLEV